jgi:predicted glycosyltransferase
MGNSITERDLVTNTLALAAILLVFTVLLIVGATDADEASMEETQYCEMTALFAETNGEFGWPKYNEAIKCEAIK